MALNQPELVTYSGAGIFPTPEGVSMNDHITAIFGTSAGAETLSRCAPVGFNDVTGYYGAWVAPDPTVLVVTLTAASSGNFTITVDGIETGNIAYDASAEAVEAALVGIGIVASVVKAAAVYTISFSAPTQVATAPTVTGDVTGITGGSPTAVPTAGTSTFGLSDIRGFIWPDEVVLDTTNQVHGEVLIKGRLSYTYIEPTVDVGDVSALQEAIKTTLLGRGIIVEDLPNIH